MVLIVLGIDNVDNCFRNMKKGTSIEKSQGLTFAPESLILYLHFLISL